MKPNRWIARLLIAALLAGCANNAPPSFQATPDFAAQHAAIHKIGVIVDSRVSYTSGIHPTPSDVAKSADLSAQGMQNIQAALNRDLAAQGYTVVMLPMDEDAREVVNTFYSARGRNINLPFPAADGNVAAVAPFPGAAALAQKAGVDAILIINGQDSAISTGAYVMAAVVVTAIVVLAVVLVAAAPGSIRPEDMQRPPPPYDSDFALFDRNGKILVYERSNMAVLNQKSVDKANGDFSAHLAAPGQ